jgi:hypothetical protein
MTLIQHAISVVKSRLDTLRAYLVRYRLALYLVSGAVVVLEVILNWTWLAAAGSHRGRAAVRVDDVQLHQARDWQVG